MEKIVLFYKYVHIKFPQEILQWQKKICHELEFTGRIFISADGINGTISGDEKQITIYKRMMNEHVLFNDIDFKEGSGSREDFPKMSIKQKTEIVHFGILPDANRRAAAHILPKDAHALLKNPPSDLLIFDVRNDYESRIGSFTAAQKAPIKNFRELPDYIDANLSQFENKTVFMYCTGGIRCELASAYLLSKNVAKTVLQLSGGIHRYAEQFPNGFFRGKNYVFDGRIAVSVTNDILTHCDRCSNLSDQYTNCMSTHCNKQIILCSSCVAAFDHSCSDHCFTLIKNKLVPVRTMHMKRYCHVK